MSYVVDIWETPTPRSFSEAVRISDELRQQTREVGGNSKYVELATRLTARYPSTMDPNIDSDDEVWSEGPIDGLTRHGCWGVGVLTQHSEEVVSYLAREANRLGLTVFDVQLGRVYIPGAMFSHEAERVHQESGTAKPWWRFWR